MAVHARPWLGCRPPEPAGPNYPSSASPAATAVARHIDGPCGTARVPVRSRAPTAHSAVISGAANAARNHTSTPSEPARAPQTDRQFHVAGTQRGWSQQMHQQVDTCQRGRPGQCRRPPPGHQGTEQHRARAGQRETVGQPPMSNVGVAQHQQPGHHDGHYRGSDHQPHSQAG